MTDALFLSTMTAFTPQSIGATVLVGGDEGRHAVSVRRIRPGEMVFVADGAGHAIHGEVLSATKAGLEVRADTFHEDESDALSIVAVQALAKGDRSELAVETMTELGITRIVPWQASRSIVRWSEGERGAKQLSRWQSTAREAAKQSRRFTIPEVSTAVSTQGVCALIAEVDLAFILHEDATVALADVLADEHDKVTSVLFITGPEGGISPDELDAFIAAGAQPVVVARHVLRASTAGVVALAQIQAGLETRHG